MNRTIDSINRVFFGATILGFGAIIFLSIAAPSRDKFGTNLSIPLVMGILVLAFVFLIYLTVIKLTEKSEGLEGFLALTLAFLGLGLFFLGFNSNNSVSPALIAAIAPVSLLICNVLEKLNVIELKSNKLERTLTFTYSALISLVVLILSALGQMP